MGGGGGGGFLAREGGGGGGGAFLPLAGVPFSVEVPMVREGTLPREVAGDGALSSKYLSGYLSGLLVLLL